MWATIFVAAGFLLAATAGGRAYCLKPSAPYCAEGYGRFDDQWEFDRCRSEMENYKFEVEQYGECVRREARNQIEEAFRDYNSAVEAFNRRARGY
jgi:hypothetical protein